jgi:hypothetical protein
MIRFDNDVSHGWRVAYTPAEYHLSTAAGGSGTTAAARAAATQAMDHTRGLAVRIVRRAVVQIE